MFAALFIRKRCACYVGSAATDNASCLHDTPFTRQFSPDILTSFQYSVNKRQYRTLPTGAQS
eukprot:7170860-Pyramimonas_sp.AAC.1